MTLDSPFDKGLQPERTLLAWRRTALSLGLGGVVGARLALDDLGGAAVVLGLVGVGVAAATYLLAARRYRGVHESLVAGRPLLAGDAAPIFAAAIGVGVVALLAIAYVLLRGLGFS